MATISATPISNGGIIPAVQTENNSSDADIPDGLSPVKKIKLDDMLCSVCRLGCISTQECGYISLY